jgi:cytochrome bd-type quinol oxidase subunit 2
VLAFLPTPDPVPVPGSSPRDWRAVLLVSAALAAFATTQPWVRVQFESLFGHGIFGPPGWASTAGFTSLCTCALVAILSLAETNTPATQHAVRPASLILVAVCTLAVTFQWWSGPGNVRGATARWTYAFWLLAAALPALLLACTLRCASLRPRTERSDA